MCFLPDFSSSAPESRYLNTSTDELMVYVEHLTIHGGEPLFCELTKKLLFQREHFPQTRHALVTNGLLLTGEVLESLHQLRLAYIDISLDACTANTYETIRRGGRFDRVIANVRNLLMARNANPHGFEVRGDFVIQEANAHEVIDFYRFCHELGIVPTFTLVSPRTVASPGPDYDAALGETLAKLKREASEGGDQAMCHRVDALNNMRYLNQRTCF